MAEMNQNASVGACSFPLVVLPPQITAGTRGGNSGIPEKFREKKSEKNSGKIRRENPSLLTTHSERKILISSHASFGDGISSPTRGIYHTGQDVEDIRSPYIPTPLVEALLDELPPRALSIEGGLLAPSREADDSASPSRKTRSTTCESDTDFSEAETTPSPSDMYTQHTDPLPSPAALLYLQQRPPATTSTSPGATRQPPATPTAYPSSACSISAPTPLHYRLATQRRGTRPPTKVSRLHNPTMGPRF